MKIKNIVISTMIILLIIGYFSLKHISKPYRNTDTVLGRISNILNENNTIHLVCEGISKSSVDINWKHYLREKTIFRRGIKRNSIGNEYGKNTFVVKVNGLFEETLVHYKSNNWYSHDYQIEIQKISPKVYELRFKVNGPNSITERIEVKL
jgi:hypothetical protein